MLNRIYDILAKTKGIAALAALCLCVISAAFGQLPTGTILGTVKDASGAVVPSTRVTAKSVETGQSRSTQTDASGSYRLVSLPVGAYEVTAEHEGFRTDHRTGLTLTVGQEAVLNFSLAVGGVEQTVSVVAEAPLVNTTSGSLGGLVEEKSIADLPLNGRNYIDLALLQTGVEQHKNTNLTGAAGGTWFSSNGAPLRSNNLLLDGALLQNVYGGSSSGAANYTPGVEGIREYRVVTNSFSAEFGMTMGSQVMIVSKGGTNKFHGSLFEYFRNSALDARNFFDYKTATSPTRLPPYRRNNFGASFGGPAIKDRTFFFAVYEGIRQRLGFSLLPTVPGAGCRGGAGAVVTNASCSQLGNVASAQISPVTAPLLALFPLPNQPGNGYYFTRTQPTTEDYGQIRVDHTFSTSDTAFGRYTLDDAVQADPQSYPQFTNSKNTIGHYFTVSESHVFSPLLLNTARFSYSHSEPQNISPSGINSPQYSFLTGKDIGSIAIGGITTFAPQTPTHHDQKIFTWGDDLFYTKGRHSLKFGALVNYYDQRLSSGVGYYGSVTFPSLNSFLTATSPQTVTALTPGSDNRREFTYKTLGFYAQDDLKLSSNFSLNAGLRYEIITIPREVSGRGAAIRDIQHDAAPTLGAAYFGRNPSLKNFGPRLGFAWDIKGDGKTAVRGGFGLLYDIGNLGSAMSIETTGNPPFSTQSTLTNPATFSLPFVFPESARGKSVRTTDYYMQQPHMLQYNLTVERQLPREMALTVAYAGSRGINLLQDKDGNPAVPQVLADGRLFWIANPPRTNPNWQQAEFNTAAGNSWYNSLQLSVLKRMSKGLQFQGSYTFSKLLDDTQGELGGENGGKPADSTHRSIDKGPASFDIKNNFRFNTIYRFQGPSGGGLLAGVLKGWWMGGILSLQSGYPLTPTLTGNRSRNGNNPVDNRPDILPGRLNDNIVSGTTAGCAGVKAGQQLGTPTLYFDPCAFSSQAPGFLGNSGRGILRDPGFATVDFSVAKETAVRALGESGMLEFRAEFFNILNRANFAPPSAAVFAGSATVAGPESALANAGKITATRSSSRQIQFALRLQF